MWHIQAITPISIAYYIILPIIITSHWVSLQSFHSHAASILISFIVYRYDLYVSIEDIELK